MSDASAILYASDFFELNMSLPSCAIAYDKFDNVLFHRFVNVGWWIDARGITGELQEVLRSEEMANYKSRVARIKMYGFVFPAELLNDLSGLPVKAVEEVIDALYTKGKAGL